jgi:hypothetical protein
MVTFHEARPDPVSSSAGFQADTTAVTEPAVAANAPVGGARVGGAIYPSALDCGQAATRALQTLAWNQRLLSMMGPVEPPTTAGERLLGPWLIEVAAS